MTPTETLNQPYTGAGNLDVMSEMSQYNRWIFETIAPFLGRSVLEAGCGNGNITRHLLQHPSLERYVGVDLSSLFCDALRQNTPPRAGVSYDFVPMDLGTPAFSTWARGRSFETIICSNVLEHIEHDANLLKVFYEMLSPSNGRLVLQVPAFQALYGSIDKVDGHYRRYTKGQLTRLLEQNGYKVRRAFYFNLCGIPAWIWHGKVLKLETHSKHELKLWDKLVPLLKKMESAIPLPAGLSVFAVAERSGTSR